MVQTVDNSSRERISCRYRRGARRLAQILPLIRERLDRLAPGSDVAAATAVRVALSHYLVRSDDADDFLAQLRHAAGIGHSLNTS